MMMIESGLRNEIARAALAYDLRFKITSELMETYLTPTYFELRQRHPELCFTEFVEELVKVRAAERKRLAHGGFGNRN
jgi:hypothetical protein